ncbi:hypothetical protein HDU78_001582 [Chytriomyces hyalinus]|nr:hypothetical protein HDU78_001582 [Chytriomyces hyalinus]
MDARLMDSKDMLGMNCFHSCLNEQKQLSEEAASLVKRHANPSDATATVCTGPPPYVLKQPESPAIVADPHILLPSLNARNCPNTHETSARTESHFFSHKPGHIQPIHYNKVNEFGLTLEQMNDLISSFQEMREIPEPDIFEYFVNDISDPDADLQNQLDPLPKDAQSNLEERDASIAVKQAGLPFPTPMPTRGTTPAARFKTLPILQNMSPFHTDQVMLYGPQHPVVDLAPARNDALVSCSLLEGKCMSSSPKQMIPISPSEVLKHISTYTLLNSTAAAAAAEVNLNGFTNITPTAQPQSHQQSFHSSLNPIPQSSPTPSPCNISEPIRPKKQLPLNLANPVKLETSETSPAQSSSSSVTSAAAMQSAGTERRSTRRGKQCRNACVHCKRSNKKCEDVRPCLRCVQTGMEDSCEDAPRKMRHGQRRRGPYRRKEETIAFDYSSVMERKLPERLSSVSSIESPIVKPQREVHHFLPRMGYFD